MEKLAILGQILLGLFFVYNGINHFIKSKAMAGYAASKKLPMAMEGVLLTGLVLLLGGLSILSGWYLVYGIWGLIAFLVIVNLTIHNFWADKDEMTKSMNAVNFNKNSALIGALLILLSFVDSWPWVL